MRVIALAVALTLFVEPVLAEGIARPPEAVAYGSGSTAPPAKVGAPPDAKPQAEANPRDLLTEAAVITALIAGSVAAYKGMGKPCACPSDTMRNGRSCGGNSAWSRANGFKPLCFPTDITASMVKAYRATGFVPAP